MQPPENLKSLGLLDVPKRAEDRGADPRILSKQKKREVEAMKIKDLAAMVRSCRNIDLINTRDSQGAIVRQHVLLNGRAIFPLDGMQPITPETLLTIADAEEDKRDLYGVRQVDMSSYMARMVDDYQEDDLTAKMGEVNLETRQEKLLSIHTDNGKETHFLPVAMLKPVKDARQLNLVIRKTVGEGRVIVALDGVVHIATFATYKTWANDETVEELHRVWLKAKELAKENEQKESESS